MFSFLKKSDIYSDDFEQIITYDIAIPTDEDIRNRIDELFGKLGKRGLSFAPTEVLKKDLEGSNYLYLLRVQRLRGVLYTHGWRQMKPADPL